MFRRWMALVALSATAVAGHTADVDADSYLVGTARVDITPAHPIRLNGFGGRRAESEGVHQRIHARAISIRHRDDAQPVVLITVDVLGIPADIRDELARRLHVKAGLQSERLAVTATHTHTGPMLKGANTTIFGVPIPDDHQKHIDEYTAVFIDRLEEAALAALKEPRPVKLTWGRGSVGFARNRRTAGGPTDHDLPVLVARDATTGRVRAVVTGYACHCVTLSHNKIGGDWAGSAAATIEGQFPGAVGLVSIGCGADQNPDSGVTGDNVEIADVQGRSVAAEVARLAGGYLAPVRGKPTCHMVALELPLAALPDRKTWEERAKRADAVGYHARVQLAKLDRGEALRTRIDYPVQTWTFGDSLAMVHLPGEVVVDYALRLKDELDRGRLWVTAYANNNPCYIPSERVLKEGGYEGSGAMIYYDLPGPFAPGLEATIIGEVRRQLGSTFAAPFDAGKTRGSRPLSPQQSQRAIRTDARFAVDLVAAEPLIASPVAIAFGADGRLWVAEMLDYPNGKSGKFEPGGRIRTVEDVDGDGTFDRATTFLDGVPFPTGVLPWRKGVLVTAAPDILYAEDTNGDGRADVVTKLFSGFGNENYQARVNGLAYGLDGWVYGSCGLFGGKILSHKTGQTLALGDRDYRINPDTGAIEPATGRTQQGRVRDDWGNWFGCDNSTLGWHYPLADHDLRRNPYVAAPHTAVSLTTGPDANLLFPLRTPQLFLLSGPAGRTTAATGIGIYRDDRLGTDFTGNAFTCESVNLLVHRSVLSPRGSTFHGDRAPAERDREFLASTDPWFRPVQAIAGPDGALWVVDMYRHVIEHPLWIPPADLAKLDVRAGAGLGRIYRVRPANGSPRGWTRLDKLDAAGLVAALDSPNGWQRDMAVERLAWAGDKSAIPHLAKLAAESKRAEARLSALVALDRLGSLSAAEVRRALTDTSAGVRRHAVRLAVPFIADLGEAVAGLAGDADAQVRLQVAVSLGAWSDPRAAAVLAKLTLAHRDDPYLVAAVLSSLHRGNLQAFVGRPEVGQLTATSLLPRLILTSAGLDDKPTTAKLVQLVTTPTDGKYRSWQFAAIDTIVESTASRRGIAETPTELANTVAAARAIALDAKADPTLRAAAVPLLGRSAIAEYSSLLVPRTPAPVQVATIAALSRTGDERAADALLAGWVGYSPALQAQALDVLLNRESWIPKVLAALTDGKIPRSAVPASERQMLLLHSDKAIRDRAEAVFAGAIDRDRQRVIDTYRKALTTGDAAKGRAVFEKSCATCHQLGGIGKPVGPDLAALANKSADYLLAEILDPNRNLDSRYLEYRAATSDGRATSGLLASESASAVTLRQADGKETTVMRTALDSLESTGRSLMPEGMEKDVTPAAMSDLIAFVASAGRPAPGDDPAALAKFLLDDAKPAVERQAVAARHADKSAAIVRALTTDLPTGQEEYRSIPWIWRVAIAAGKRNDAGELRAILDAALPKKGEPLRDWQAVVVGGGVINGLSQLDLWPGPRIKAIVGNDAALAERWALALKASVAMVDNDRVPTGTRYDALRMIPLLGWDAAGRQLSMYLAKGANDELQMGAVSGTVDVDAPEASRSLIDALAHLTGTNRTLALHGLTRTESRAVSLLDAVEAGRVAPASVDKAAIEALKKSKSERVRSRAAAIFKVK